MSENRKTAVDFLTMVCAGDVRGAFDRHVDPAFRHHNAYFPGDRQSLLEAMEENARQNPAKAIAVKKILEDGDTVAVFSHMKPDPAHKGFALVHIFRFDGDRIVELWDTGQPVPDESPNENGMF